MRLSLDRIDGNLINGYASNGVVINQKTVEHSVIVTPQDIAAWPPACFEDISAEHFELLLAYSPELVLLGTGPRIQFPPPAMTQSLLEAQIGVEVMDTIAACRTYNILMAEGRAVVAALLPPGGADSG